MNAAETMGSEYMGYSMRIALGAVAASPWLHDAAAQSPPAVPPRAGAEPVIGRVQ